METVAVCLYSKYSQRCKEFLDDIDPNMGVHMLCIDNEQVRQTILNDDHGYHIKTVPCVFLFYPNGRLEKYEGSDAFTWLRKVKEAMSQQQFQQPIQQQPIQQIQQQPFQQQPIQGQPLQPLEFQQPLEPQFQAMAPPPNSQEPLDITPMEEPMSPPQNAEDIINQEMELRRASDQIITRKQDNIKELAQMMQRQRESDDDKIAPPPLYPKEEMGGRRM